MPAADENGPDYATFRFKVGDGLDFSADDYAMTVDVAPVNDPPIPSETVLTATERRLPEDPVTILDVLDGALPRILRHAPRRQAVRLFGGSVG